MFASTATTSPTGRTGIAMTAAAITQSNARRASSSVLIAVISAKAASTRAAAATCSVTVSVSSAGT